jgi:hypothetical protein
VGRIPVKESFSRGISGKFSEKVFTLEMSGIYDKIFMRELRKKSPYEFIAKN